MKNFRYRNNNGDFTLENPEKYSYLYFPMANESGMMSSITPELGGDIKTSQNAFLLAPVSSENIHNDKSTRNIWCKINQSELWSATGRSSVQQSEKFIKEKEETNLDAEFMCHTITRKSERSGISSKITSFVPMKDTVELIKVTFTNISKEIMTIQPIIAIPFYARSADNIRDHRHVTALLHRICTVENGVVVNPTLTFDERGHRKNEVVYGIFAESQGEKPIGFYPIVEDFIGEGGNFENPRSLRKMVGMVESGVKLAGYEAMGGIVFREYELKPGEEKSLIVVLGIGQSERELREKANTYIQESDFEKALKETREYWKNKVNVSYQTGNDDFNNWMRWVSFQPMLRRIYGCSFLPHHDYGKGGRGWRDLWQDCLALLMMEPAQVRQMLIDNFAGVRMDGTNATIIGSKQGEFIADRNNITRVWMDHGVWPFLTTDLYIEQTGDINILLEENCYFKDAQICRGEAKDTKWDDTYGNRMMDERGNVYRGSILEHLLIQHLTSFYDVGEHNHVRIRGADWNDALDLADERGESVAFTTMYAKNLEKIAELLMELSKVGIRDIYIEENLKLLVVTDQSVYEDIEKKHEILKEYCNHCSHKISGNKCRISCIELAANLKEKGKWMKEHIQKNEWITASDGNGWFNGYYDNGGRMVEGEYENGIRMMLTSQVFSIMSETASKEQVKTIIKSVDKYLYEEKVGGYRLNTNFHEVKMDLGRMFGFAYGHKENGAVFSHMAVMYANALYSRGEAGAGFKAIHTLFEHCNDFERSKIYPGVPEYIDAKGRGMYHYLTGAASWLLVTVITQMFGIKGDMGNLIFEPKLLKQQFDSKKEAAILLQFAGRKLHIIYRNYKDLEFEEYKVNKIILDEKEYEYNPAFSHIRKEDVLKLADERVHTIVIELDEEK